MSRLLASAASLKLTFPAMVALVIGVLVTYRAGLASTWWVTAPLIVLAVNLGAALVVHPRFRRQPGLLCFHLALLAILVLGALEQLYRFEGRVELLVGEAFDPRNVESRVAGPLFDPGRLDGVRFRQGHFSVEYAPNLTRGATHSRAYRDDGDAAEIVGDTRPFRMAGFHLHTTSNKGYAALLRWEDRERGRVFGAVHFPSYPLRDWRQTNRWTTPGGEPLELELVLPGPAGEAGAWRLDSGEVGRLPVSLRVRWEGREFVVGRGEWLSVANGRLGFESLRMWMGYQVSFNPFLAWLLVAGTVGVVGLAWHFWRKLWSRPLAGATTTSGRRARDAAVVHP